MPCEGAGASGEMEDEEGKCRVSVHYEGEGDPVTNVTNGAAAKTGVL